MYSLQITVSLEVVTHQKFSLSDWNGWDFLTISTGNNSPWNFYQREELTVKSRSASGKNFPISSNFQFSTGRISQYPIWPPKSPVYNIPHYFHARRIFPSYFNCRNSSNFSFQAQKCFSHSNSSLLIELMSCAAINPTILSIQKEDWKNIVWVGCSALSEWTKFCIAWSI